MQQYRRGNPSCPSPISTTRLKEVQRASYNRDYYCSSMRKMGHLRCAIFGTCLLLLIACSGNESEFQVVDSPDAKFTLIVTVTEPVMPHALHKVTLYIEARDSDIRQKLLESPLANDGVPFTAKNIGVRWTSRTTALVCLRPTDLADHGIRVDVLGVPSAELRPGC